MQRRSKSGATHFDNGAVSSGSLDAWVWAERISVVGLFTLAVGYTLFVVRDLFVPVVTAWVMGAILRPIVESAERVGVPRVVAVIVTAMVALLILLAIMGLLIYTPCLLDRSHQRTRAADKRKVATPKSALGDL